MIPVTRPNAPGHWLLDLTLGGRTYRIADVDLEVTTAAGELLDYVAGLADLALTIAADGAEPIAIEIGPWRSDSWGELVADGADLAAASATLRRWYEGTSWEVAELVAAGPLVEPEYETPDDPVTFSVDLPRYDRTATVPALTQRIDATTWPVTSSPFQLQPDPAMDGAAYPVVYGRPGKSGSFVWGTLPVDEPGSPAYLAEHGGGAHNYLDSKLIVAGHAVEAAEVYLVKASSGYDRSRSNVQKFTVETGADLRGQVVSFVRRSGYVGRSSRMQWEPGSEFYVAWTDGGGKVDPESGEAFRRLGQVVIDLLLSAGVPVARGRAEAARAQLDRFLVDVAISEPVRPEDWIEAQIGSLLPLLRRETPEGVWYELWRYSATEPDAVIDLVGDPIDESGVDGTPVLQTSPIRFTDLRGVENNVTLRYHRSIGDYRRSLTVRGGVIDATDVAANELGSILASASLARYGERFAELSGDWIVEDSTASAVLTERLAWTSLARRTLTVSGGPDLAWLEPNAVIRYTREQAGIYRQLALVRSVTIGVFSTELAIELLDRPDRRGRV